MQHLNETERDCLKYFKSEPVWYKLLSGFWEKYASFGSFTGSVRVANPSAHEIDVLEGFLGRNFHGQKSISISAECFSKALNESRYADVSSERLLELYFGTAPISKKEQKENEEKKQQKIEAEFFSYCEKTAAKSFLSELLDLQKGSVKKDLQEWKRLLFLSADMINELPYRNDSAEYLPVFAARLTKNPHAFDRGTTQGDLLYQVVLLDLAKRQIKVTQSEQFSSYKRQKSFLACGILLDDMSNYVLLYNAAGVRKDGAYHRGLEGFFAEHDMLQVPLTVLTKLKYLESPDKTLYIDENPSAFAFRCAHNPDSTCLCMNGQPKLAALIALELFAASGTTVYYSGDFDPEGLWIAQRLAIFYPGTFHFLNMDETSYLKCLSEEPISDTRLKQLDRITDSRLLGTVARMRIEKMAGYQEVLTLI